MNAKEYLSQALWLDKKINSKLKQADHLRGLTQKTTTTLRQDPVTETRQRGRMEHSLVRLIDLEREIDKDIDRLADLRQEMLAWIGKLKDISYSQVLEFRYIYGYTWAKVSKVVGYNLRWVYRLHERALQELDAIFEREDEVSLKDGAPRKKATIGHYTPQPKNDIMLNEKE